MTSLHLVQVLAAIACPENLVAPLWKSQKFNGKITCGIGYERVPTPGVEIREQFDEGDVLDANRYPARAWGGWIGVGLFGGFWGIVTC